MLGGVPAFESPLFVGSPNQPCRETLFRRIGESLNRNVLSNFGPWNKEFSREIRRQTGVGHALPVTNGTIGLELAIRALGLEGEIIVPAFTFVATAHAVQWLGLTPVFADVDPVTHCIDPASIRRRITPRTSGIIGVHLWGQPCDVEQIAAIAREHDLKVIYDAAHAYGAATADGVPVGNFGDAEVFSFHATKFVNSLEGGAVLTNSDELARSLVMMCNFGFAGYDQVESVGTNGKLNEISAAVGLGSLEQIERIVEINRANFEAYRAHLSGMPGLRIYEPRPGVRTNYQYVVIEVDRQAAGLSRDQLLTVLHAENVIARRYFYPGCHRMEPYRSQQDPASREVPVADRLVESVLILPTGSRVGPDAVERIAAIIRQAIAEAPHIRRLLGDAAVQKAAPFKATDF